jgi:uncharacterized protein (TIGR01777 family)
MGTAFTLITIQALLGGLDNFWHHEITERLPAKRSAARELTLHALREFLYGFVFIAFAWYRWQGLWAALIGAVLVLEIVVTLADFVIEDQTRKLPPFERVLHTLLALNYGAALALIVPMLVAWSKLPTTVVPTSNAFSWVFTFFGVGVLAWSVRNAIAVLKLRRPPEWVRNPIAAGQCVAPRTILISGATGFIGGHLVRRLITRGDNVLVLTRNPDVALNRFGPHVRIVTDLDSLDPSTGVDAIVNLAGAPILGLPWTRRRRRCLLTSRIETTRALTAVMGRLKNPVRVFISASAIGYYGVRGNEVIDEGGRPTEDFQSQLCQEWEATARTAVWHGARLVRMRIGLVLGRDGGALPRLARPVRFGMGAILGAGRQWVSWIHIDDLVRLFEFSLDTPIVSGAINAVSPVPVTHRQFQASMAAVLRRPLWMRIPAVFIRLGLGEMAQLLVDGQRVVPTRASGLRFQFGYVQIRDALTQLLRADALRDGDSDIYFNGECPLCNAEMRHYASACAEVRPELHFIDSAQRPDALARCGLRREHLQRRVYIRHTDGRILSGMPALIALWSAIPKYQWLARLMRLPLLRQLATVLYDHAIAPTLASWAIRRHAASAATTKATQ